MSTPLPRFALAASALLLVPALAAGPTGASGSLTGASAAKVQMVYIQSAPGSFAPSSGLVIDQKNLQYAPHVSAVLTGSTVNFHTADAQLHNVFVRQNGETLTNTAMPPGSQNVGLTFDKAGVARVTCVVHKDMLAWILVLDNPFFSEVKGGTFSIPALPPGKYTLRVWGEKLTDAEKAKTYAIEVKAGAPLSVAL